MLAAIDRRSVVLGLGAAAGASLGHPAFAAAIAAAGPVVSTAAGKVQGYRAGGVHVFRGLRYGAPTGGANRFKPPMPPAPWPAIQRAIADGPSAPQQPDQPSEFEKPNSFETSEDCLFLNVFTPAVGDGPRRPVMVWIHGGGYSKGSGTDPRYDGSRLAHDNDVVLVTLNHRLNAFGYLYLGDLLGPDYADSGNSGQLDIVAALEWVRDNVAQFGGDPGNVTVFGHSSGGVKICALMAMPRAKGLFHKVIIESGAALKIRDLAAARAATAKTLDILGLTRETAAKVLTLSTTAFLPFGGLAGNVGSGPLMDGRSIPRQPFEPGATPLAQGIPLLIGSAETEMTIAARPGDFAMTRQELTKRVAPQLGGATDDVLDVYFASRPAATPGEIYFFLTADLRATKPTILLAERQAVQNKAPVYVYRMTWRTPVGGGRLMSPHGIELPFVWNNLDASRPLIGYGSELQPMATRMSRMWAAFARTGDPNIPASQWWERFTPEGRATMMFGTEDRMVYDPYASEREILLRAPPGPFG